MQVFEVTLSGRLYEVEYTAPLVVSPGTIVLWEKNESGLMLIGDLTFGDRGVTVKSHGSEPVESKLTAHEIKTLVELHGIEGGVLQVCRTLFDI